jgi:hypothetical protein
MTADPAPKLANEEASLPAGTTNFACSHRHDALNIELSFDEAFGQTHLFVRNRFDVMREARRECGNAVKDLTIQLFSEEKEFSDFHACTVKADTLPLPLIRLARTMSNRAH